MATKRIDDAQDDATHCQGCDIPLPPRDRKRGHAQKWCSERCAAQHRPSAKKRITESRYCNACGSELPLPIEGRGPRKWCERCAKWTHRGRQPPWLRPPTPWIAGRCAECDEWFVAKQPQSRFCSHSCQRQAHERGKDQRRRQRKRDTTVNGEYISLARVAVRDGGRCHICRCAVSREQWSLDHLVPLSLGGTHTLDNIALAHRLCNAARGNMPFEETQTILVAAHAAFGETTA